jgi:quercetin dioxygenase-like cupin family protein
MPVERAAEHPTFELGGNTVTSLAAPSRGAVEAALFRIALPPRGDVPRHHHDHLDVFAVETGDGVIHIGEEQHAVAAGDSVVVPTGVWHTFVAGDQGATLAVTMLAGTKMVREDGSEFVSPWVS